ncbi:MULTISPECIES: IMS domain-containing protein [unclassified Prochlorococcus]|uniref:IMS domain-containing protein n=1 Tax=unclassified Prochlorococcus TaxID=2627481 RepID=UPI000533845D|nr:MULTISPECIES: IMS domain-containing protein [unclassified Prochlorococcus]KGG15472.1 Cell division protein ZipN/Ftn2/Arc6 [Prochlorococcus sp. MIT 0602]KGG17752.1 Cell division protein ZipN/Ftn2/Arc6 [Prochlorococcus sp. MIT 0603]
MENNNDSFNRFKFNDLIKNIINLILIGIGLGIITGTLLKINKDEITKDYSKSDSNIGKNQKQFKPKENLKDPIPYFKKSIKSNENNYSTKDYSHLTEKYPSEVQIRILIQEWLKAKSDILSGNENSNLLKVADNKLVNIVKVQRRKDMLSGEKQIINAKIDSLEIKEQLDKRIEVNVIIQYNDKRISKYGEVIKETNLTSLKIKYILGKIKGKWKLLDFYNIK